MIQEHQKLIRTRSGDTELICIVCPIGCHMTVDRTGGDTVKVQGNRCRRGQAYAEEEFSNPRRVVTATASIRGGISPRLPVRSSSPVPVDRVAAFLAEVYRLQLESPVRRGDVIAENLADTGVHLLASMSVSGTPGDDHRRKQEET